LAISVGLSVLSALLVKDFIVFKIRRSLQIPLPENALFSPWGATWNTPPPSPEARSDIAKELFCGFLGSGVLIGFAALSTAMAAWVSGPGSHFLPLRAALDWVALIGSSLAIFNLIPCHPLAGGKIVEALIVRATGNQVRAISAARFGGYLLVALCLAYGLATLAAVDSAWGLWWIILAAATLDGLD
jgi:Zn-dependent protease